MGVATAGTAAWDLRIRIAEANVRRRAASAGLAGTSVTPPLGGAPERVRGREQVLTQLERWLRKPSGSVVVIGGMGGTGKSTVAMALARRATRTRRAVGRRHRPVWWVQAADSISLSAGLASVARQLGAEHTELDAIVTGAADGADRFWELLDKAPAGWLLVLDGADSPGILAGTRGSGLPPAPVGDGTGWVRPSRRGLTLVTSRDAAQETWGRHARVVRLGPLGEAEAARALRDLAPEAGDDAQARRLARRLGGLPLALHLAGTYMRSSVVRLPTFAAYGAALDEDGGLRLLDRSRTDDRAVVARTWEITLDELARTGTPHARTLLRLLSCYAADAPIPLDLLDSSRVSPLLPAEPSGRAIDRDLHVEDGLRGLERLGLIESRPAGTERGIALHALVVETNRMHLPAMVAPTAAAVRQTAVDLVVDALSGLEVDAPADWPRYRVLGVHLRALLDTAAPHLAGEGLATLLRATWLTTRALDESGAHDVSERLNRAALAHVPGPEDVVGLHLRHQLAWQIAARGEYAAAAALFTEVRALRTRLLGDDHPDTLGSSHELAWVAGCQERWSDAEAQYDRVLADRRRVLGERHRDTLLTRFERAWSIANQQRFDEAKAELEQVLRERTALLGATHDRTVGTRHELAWIAAKQGRLVEAERLYRQVLADRRGALGEEHLLTLTVRQELAWVLACQGRFRKAKAHYTQVLDARRRRLGAEHPATRETLHALEELGHRCTVDARHLV
ncbi:tetratricopeptide repeat protein [Streptomyces sp. NBC_01190]|uniref:tetratricopeptide repeat protein n=1 Tax=Streptomyces sp. NBC_01190 TaxID=2903767 RepID=UPI00386ED3EB|nr:tetratricopeptide repeat protein [Streptomyces sp. NBC_01190]